MCAWHWIRRGLSCGLLVFVLNVPASAHDTRPLYIALSEVAPLQFSLAWKMPPITPPTTPQVSLPECQRQSLTQFICPQDPETIALTFSNHTPSIPILINTSWVSGQSNSYALSPGLQDLPVQPRETTTGVGAGYLWLGTEHILLGWDHLCFVVVLMLLATSWRQLMWAVLGFTLGHSITLSLGALNLLFLPVSFIEFLIALSIMVLAAEVLRPKHETLTRRYPLLISSSFGLLHGMGFANILQSIGLPQTQLVTALLAFNLGVELGQVLFIIAGLLLARLILQLKWLTSRQGTSLLAFGAGTLAGYWSLERGIGLFIS